MGAAAPIRKLWEGTETVEVTLLELVRAVGEATEDDQEVVATVLQMLRSGRARLTGNFSDTPPDEF